MKKSNLVLTGLILFLSPAELFAQTTADSTSGELLSSWWIDFALLLLVLLAIYSIYTSFIIYNKNRQARSLLTNLDQKSSAHIWHLKELRERVKKIYDQLQAAEKKGDAKLLEGFLSNHFYNHYDLQFANLSQKNEQEVIKHPRLNSFYVMSVTDHVNEEDDAIWVYLKYKELDYTIEKNSQTLMTGNPASRQAHKELWKLIRENNQWVLDEIRENVTLKDIEALTPTTDELK